MTKKTIRLKPSKDDKRICTFDYYEMKLLSDALIARAGELGDMFNNCPLYGYEKERDRLEHELDCLQILQRRILGMP